MSKLDISQAKFYGCSDEAVLELIEWRKSIKKPMTQGVLNNALKVAFECLDWGYDSIEDVFIRWQESGWTGIKFVKKEAMREFCEKVDNEAKAEARSTRDLTLKEELENRSWSH